jgi:uncharacterized protein YajQ (UPF0234 family)
MARPKASQWAGLDSNQRSGNATGLQPVPFGHSGTDPSANLSNLHAMPSFDVVSEVDLQEVRNAVDQASRELATRFDFKGTDSVVELKDNAIQLESASEERLKAVTQVLEEKMVKRKVSLKALDYGKIEEATHGRARQNVTLAVGINDEKAREIGKFIKGLGLKGVQHQVQGDQLRVTGKKRDDLQKAIQSMKDKDFGVPLQFTNFRD